MRVINIKNMNMNMMNVNVNMIIVKYKLIVYEFITLFLLLRILQWVRQATTTHGSHEFK